MQILVPKHYVKTEDLEGPLFFLAGPVRGGDDWQKVCAELIAQRLPKCSIAIPYYVGGEIHYPLLDVAATGDLTFFERQLNWERHYIEQAAKIGCLIFWLPNESKIHPRSDGAFATDTRGEIGRWSVEQKYNPDFRVVVGAQLEFPSLSQIQRNFSLDQDKEVTFFGTLEEVVDEAVRKATS